MDGHNWRQKYDKMRLREVEDRRAIEELLKENPLDKCKFIQRAQQSFLPVTYRPLVWKLLLGIIPKYAESQEYVRQQQTLIFEGLWRTLKALRLQAPFAIRSHSVHSEENMGSVVATHTSGANGCLSEISSPEPEHLLLMWLISEARLLHSPLQQLSTPEHQRYVIIAQRLNTLFDDPVDQFQLFSALWSMLRVNEAPIIASVHEGISLLRLENDNLYLHLQRIGLLSSRLLENHCLTLFCDIFPESAVESILDKIIAGAYRFLAYVIFALLCQLQAVLFSARNVEGIQNAFLQLRTEEAEAVVRAAADRWHKATNQK